MKSNPMRQQIDGDITLHAISETLIKFCALETNELQFKTTKYGLRSEKWEVFEVVNEVFVKNMFTGKRNLARFDMHEWSTSFARRQIRKTSLAKNEAPNTMFTHCMVRSTQQQQMFTGKSQRSCNNMYKSC